MSTGSAKAMVTSSSIAVLGRIECRLQYKSNFALSVTWCAVILFAMIYGSPYRLRGVYSRQVMGGSRQKWGTRQLNG